MSSDITSWQPRWPRATAALICTAAALVLLWPLLGGEILFGGGRSDMFIAGYSFRLFGAEQFKATGSIPQWNPYLFGGLPYIGAMHGDIFYPTAWLRWIMPVDLAITWGMAIHFILAGWFTYIFARSLRLGFTAAIVAAVGYELSGIVASQMSPGHDGKLFVSALAPLAFWVAQLAIRDGKQWAYGAFAIVTALLILGHYQMCYFLLMALGLWTLYLAFWSRERAPGTNPWIAVGLMGIAVVIGIGITGLQVVPFLEYIKWSPRAAGGPNTGWEWVNTYAMPPGELFTLVLPEFNGVLDHYWGTNPIKFHTEYVGVMMLVLAFFAWGDTSRRRLVVALLTGTVLFQFIAFAGHTPIYRVFYELVPMLSKLRAVGMVFFLVAFLLSILAAIGLERILARQVDARKVLLGFGALGLLALLGVTGVLQAIAQSMAIPERVDAVVGNSAALRTGAIRLLFFTLAAGGVVWAAASGKLRNIGVTAALLLVTVADLWSVDRAFYIFSPRADVLFRDDAVTTYLKQQPMPFRVLNAQGTYPQSTLMAYRIPSAWGYHGNELRGYQELGGQQQGWSNLASPNLMELLSIRFIVLADTQAVPGFHRVVGPAPSTFGGSVALYERDTLPAYARVVPAAAKAPEAQIPPTVVNPRFPVNVVALYADTAALQVAPLPQPLPAPTMTASVTKWEPGSMQIALAGQSTQPGYLIVAENWYPDWQATIDGQPATAIRADNALLSVVVPPGAREVSFRFDSAGYRKGRMLTVISLLLAAAAIAAGAMRTRRRAVA